MRSQHLEEGSGLFRGGSHARVAKTAKSNRAGATTIGRIDTHHTTFQTQIMTELLELLDCITLPLLQHLIKLSRRETSGLLIPLEWYEGDEEFFQVLVKLVQSPLHPLIEEGFERLVEILDIVIETLDGDSFNWRTGQC